MLVLRAATSSDAEAVIHVHHAAVHGTASAHYSPEMIAAWSPLPAEARYQWMRELILSGEEMMVVAEAQSALVGFGFIIPRLSELRALYVHPAAARQGVGKAILKELEAAALAQGISCLRLNASLNAEAFYQGQGYHVLSRGTLSLDPQHHMECIRMEKRLSCHE